jgi:hypothetical protein
LGRRGARTKQDGRGVVKHVMKIFQNKNFFAQESRRDRAGVQLRSVAKTASIRLVSCRARPPGKNRIVTGVRAGGRPRWADEFVPREASRHRSLTGAFSKPVV